jgi:uncharacterized membrane protein HdeD (DUF308 family)
MKTSRGPRIVAGVLLLISAITHVLQLFVYGTAGHVIGAAAFGVLYLVVGIFLIAGRRWAPWLGATLPGVGGVLGILRFIFRQSTPFIIFHVLVDLVVVPLCIYILVQYRKEKQGLKVS